MIDARHLGPGGICGEARHLLAENLIWTVDDLRRDAFVAMVALGDARFEAKTTAKEILDTALGALTPTDRLAVDGWYADYVEDMRRGTIPAIHVFDRPLAMEANGKVVDKPAAYTPTTILANADCAWCTSESSGKDPETIAVVLQHYLDAPGERLLPQDDLHLAYLALAWAETNEVDRARVGRCFHRPAGEPRYEWSPVLGERELASIWQRVRKAVAAPRAAVVSGYCERCPAHRHCGAWLLPAVAGAHEALRPFQRKGGPPLNKQSAGKALRIVGAMKEAVAVMESNLRAFARAEGGIPDGHGNVWGPVQGKGKQTDEVFRWQEVK